MYYHNVSLERAIRRNLKAAEEKRMATRKEKEIRRLTNYINYWTNWLAEVEEHRANGELYEVE